MFFIYFIYGLILGVLLFVVFKSALALMLLYILVAELIIFLMYFSLNYVYNPIVRLAYNICLLLGYFSGLILYGTIDYNDPNIPNFFQ